MGSIVNGIGLTDGMLKPYGSTFLIFSDYMRPAVRLSALGAHAVALGLDARLGRRRRGRPDPPARRAPHGAPGDPEPLVRAPRRRERDRRWRGGSRWSAKAARSRSPSRARSWRRSTAPRSPRPRARCAARTRSGSRATACPTCSCSRPAPSSGRLRGGALDRDVNVPRRLDAVLGALRRAAAGLPRRRDPARRAGAPLGRGRDPARLGALDRRGGCLGGDRPLRRVGARRRGAATPRLHARERGHRARPRCSSGSRDESRGRVRPPRRQAARAHPGGARRARPRDGRPRHRHRRQAHRLPGQGARGGGGDPRRRRRARRPRLRLGRGRLGRRLQDRPGSGPRSATTSTRRIRASSTTT